MQKVQNKIMLITYSDSMGGDLKELYEVLDTHYEELSAVSIFCLFILRRGTGVCRH